MLQAGTTYQAALETSNDEDWYAFYLLGSQQVTFDVTPVSGGCDDFVDLFRPEVFDNDGNTLHEFRGDTDFSYTTPAGATARYYLHIYSGEGSLCQYQLSVSPQAAGVTAPPELQRVPVPEPNDTEQQAFGPLSAGRLYQGAIETTNDVETMYFFAAPHSHVTAEVTEYGSCTNTEGNSEIDASVSAAGSSTSSATFRLEPNTRSASTIDTGARATKYYVDVSGGETCHWQLEIEPSNALLGGIDTTAPRQRSLPPRSSV